MHFAVFQFCYGGEKKVTFRNVCMSYNVSVILSVYVSVTLYSVSVCVCAYAGILTDER